MYAHGSLIAFDAQGAQIAQAPLTLIDPAAALIKEWNAQRPRQLAFDGSNTGPVLLNYSCSIYPY